jgi:hypothetical protein
MLSIPAPNTFFSDFAGKEYRINFTPEASQSLISQAIHYIAAPSQNPFTLEKIAHMLVMYGYENKVPILNAPYAMLYGCRVKGKVYQIVASLMPDANNGSIPVCEIHRFQESTDSELNKLVP